MNKQVIPELRSDNHTHIITTALMVFKATQMTIKPTAKKTTSILPVKVVMLLV